MALSIQCSIRIISIAIYVLTIHTVATAKATKSVFYNVSHIISNLSYFHPYYTNARPNSSAQYWTNHMLNMSSKNFFFVFLLNSMKIGKVVVIYVY